MKPYYNEYIIDGDIAYGKTSNNIEYIVDAEDVPRLRNYNCYKCADSNAFMIRSHVDNKGQSLIRFILGLNRNDKTRAKRINPNINDFRKSNLWSGNKYQLVDDYYVVSCWNGKQFIIDADDYELVSKYNWHVDTNGYVVTDRVFGKKAIKLHRLVMGVIDKPELEVDHIYHDTCDNRKANMRICGRSENMHNVKRNNKSKWGCPGVELVKGYDNMWKVTMTVNGERLYFGCYYSLDEAIKVRLQAEKDYNILRVC